MPASVVVIVQDYDGAEYATEKPHQAHSSYAVYKTG